MNIKNLIKKLTMRRIILILYLTLTMMGQPLSMAEGLPVPEKTEGLQALIEEALRNNPQLKAAREDWKAAQKRVPQASALPDPTAGYSFMGPMIVTFNGPGKERYEFEQMVPFPGKLAGRRNVAKAEAAASEARMKQAEREVIFKVCEAYYDLVTTEKTIGLVEEIKNALQQSQAASRARYAANQIMQSEFIKIQTAISENVQRLFMLEQQRDTMRALLQSLLNRSSPIDIPAVDLQMPKANFPWEDVQRHARQSRPQLRESVAMAQKSAHALNLAKLENAPDFSIGFEYSRISVGESNSPDAGKDAWMIPVKITLPIWQNRIGSGIEEAHANLNAARAQLKQEENSTEYEVKAAYYRFITAQKTVSLYENALIPQAQLMADSNEAGYKAGHVDVTDFVSSRVNFFNTRIAYYEALSNAWKELAALQREIGKNLTLGE